MSTASSGYMAGMTSMGGGNRGRGGRRQDIQNIMQNTDVIPGTMFGGANMMGGST